MKTICSYHLDICARHSYIEIVTSWVIEFGSTTTFCLFFFLHCHSQGESSLCEILLENLLTMCPDLWFHGDFILSQVGNEDYTLHLSYVLLEINCVSCPAWTWSFTGSTSTCNPVQLFLVWFLDRFCAFSMWLLIWADRFQGHSTHLYAIQCTCL